MVSAQCGVQYDNVAAAVTNTVPEWAESLKNCSLSESGFVLKSTLLG